MANKHLTREQHAALVAKNVEYADMLIREMNTKTWTPSEDGRRKGKDRVTQTINLLIKLQALLDGPNKGKADAKTTADAFAQMEAMDQLEAARKKAEQIKKGLIN